MLPATWYRTCYLQDRSLCVHKYFFFSTYHGDLCPFHLSFNHQFVINLWFHLIMFSSVIETDLVPSFQTIFNLQFASIYSSLKVHFVAFMNWYIKIEHVSVWLWIPVQNKKYRHHCNLKEVGEVLSRFCTARSMVLLSGLPIGLNSRYFVVYW